uniref:Growth hormone secretagogue receptor type 1 n=1 Tax=Callorhinchus milii TaxID=7868 RepID=A0A4W3J453_CALMI|eukprot:gi/632985302/ref/XP_007909603.1/ PREDICTED: growth hormone secretagogue receptor type 1-like [Callorhinchus milii]
MQNSTSGPPDGNYCSESGCNQTKRSVYYELPDDIFSLPVLTGVTVVCIFLFIVGVLGNVLTILLVAKYKEMKTTTNLYLSSMALSDIVIFMCMPLDLYKIWKYKPWSFGELICKLSQFVSEGCTYATILHITALSMERYVAVCFPLKAKVFGTKSRIKAIIVGLWMAALTSAGPVFLLVGVEFQNGTDPSKTSECKCTEYAVSSGLLNAMTWVSSFYFFVPVCCLTILYGLIGRKLWRRRRRNHRDRSNRQTIKMLAAIVLGFVLCWLPFHIGRNLSSMSAGTPQMYVVSQYFHIISFVLFYLSAAINPILYNIMSGRYRAAMCKMLSGNRSHRRENAVGAATYWCTDSEAQV